MFSGYQKDGAKALLVEKAGFLVDFLERQGDPGDVVMTRESAVAANIYALIGQIEWGEHPYGFPEMLKGGRLG